jgi:hypothetical protein
MATIGLSYFSGFYIGSEQKGHILDGWPRKTQIAHRERNTKL